MPLCAPALWELEVLVNDVQQGERTLGWCIANVWVGTERPIEESFVLVGLLEVGDPFAVEIEAPFRRVGVAAEGDADVVRANHDTTDKSWVGDLTCCFYECTVDGATEITEFGGIGLCPI